MNEEEPLHRGTDYRGDQGAGSWSFDVRLLRGGLYLKSVTFQGRMSSSSRLGSTESQPPSPAVEGGHGFAQMQAQNSLEQRDVQHMFEHELQRSGNDLDDTGPLLCQHRVWAEPELDSGLHPAISR